jgi:hypothetical protein
MLLTLAHKDRESRMDVFRFPQRAIAQVRLPADKTIKRLMIVVS